jgi:hypothetical protein
MAVLATLFWAAPLLVFIVYTLTSFVQILQLEHRNLHIFQAIRASARVTCESVHFFATNLCLCLNDTKK